MTALLVLTAATPTERASALICESGERDICNFAAQFKLFIALVNQCWDLFRSDAVNCDYRHCLKVIFPPTTGVD